MVSSDHPAYVRHPEFNDENRYFVASSFGPLYGWNGGYVHPSYAFDKYTRGRAGSSDEHTAGIYARFLTTLGESINRIAAEDAA